MQLVSQLDSLARHVLKSQKSASNTNTADTLQNAIVEVLLSQVSKLSTFSVKGEKYHKVSLRVEPTCANIPFFF